MYLNNEPNRIMPDALPPTSAGLRGSKSTGALVVAQREHPNHLRPITRATPRCGGTGAAIGGGGGNEMHARATSICRALQVAKSGTGYCSPRKMV